MEEQISGFDSEAGKYFIYPTNYPKREYQFNIIKEALLKNTLVSLPTGLGKTFIAAVVMYNYYRWFPSCKIIFMAPTKPLVKQQIDACYNIMAIPKEVTAEITGVKASSKRKELWKTKSVFFITPHVLQNDLDTEEYLGKQIRCLVIDEAHKARGNYAYCEVIKKLLQKNEHFRILALSATPGSTFDTVLEIVNSLLISHIEFRTRNSPDILPYIFTTKTEVIVVPLGETILHIKEIYEKVLEYYSRILIKNNVITGNCRNLTKGRIIFITKNLKEKHKQMRINNYSEVMGCLNICVTLYHAYELLISYGLTSFCSFLKEHLQEKAYLRGNKQLIEILHSAENHLGPPSNVQHLPDGSIPEISHNVKFGHPKFYKLAEVISSHFEQFGEKTKVIVFCEYRESVMEAYAILLKYRPIIKPRIFLGQKSMNQNQQIITMKKFRSGEYNTLLATSIAEEGLDIGEVDLIVCFDVHTKSPIRMVQRMGRTGRKSQGRVVFLVTDGKEHQMLQEGLNERNCVFEKILKSSQLSNNLYQNNPRMIPLTLEPKCRKLHMTVDVSTGTKSITSGKKHEIKQNKKEKGNKENMKRDIRDMFNAMPTIERKCLTIDPKLNIENKSKHKNDVIYVNDDTNYLNGFNMPYYNELIQELDIFTNINMKDKRNCTICKNCSWAATLFHTHSYTIVTLEYEASICFDDVTSTTLEDFFNISPRKEFNMERRNCLHFFKLSNLEDIFTEDLNDDFYAIASENDISSIQHCKSSILHSLNKFQTSECEDQSTNETRKMLTKECSISIRQKLLHFFKINSIEDIFDDENTEVHSEIINSHTPSKISEDNNTDKHDFISLSQMVDGIYDVKNNNDVSLSPDKYSCTANVPIDILKENEASIACEKLQKIQESLTQDEINKILGIALDSDHSDEDLQIKRTNKKIYKKKQSALRSNDCKKNFGKEFLELEAEISSDENSSSDEIHSESLDSSFIDDDADTNINNSIIHAHYLQSTKNALQCKGPFKIPSVLPKRMDIFSQVDNRENSYLLDSFCVDTNDIIEDNHVMSELEQAEAILKRKRSKRKKNSKTTNRGTKRKRIQIESSSGESD